MPYRYPSKNNELHDSVGQQTLRHVYEHPRAELVDANTDDGSYDGSNKGKQKILLSLCMKIDESITAQCFATLSPYARGYMVYLCGARDDVPNVPNERNPYPQGSRKAAEWDRGQAAAARDAQDGDDG